MSVQSGGSTSQGWPAPSVGPHGLDTLLPPPPPAPPGKRRWIRWAAAAGAVLVVLGVLVVPKVVRAVSGPVRGANVYLGLLRDGATDVAYGSLCSELRAQTTPADYAAALRAEEEQGGRLVSFNVYKSMVEVGGNKGLVEYQARTEKGTLVREARMVREGGQWHWCGSRPQPKSTGFTVHVP